MVTDDGSSMTLVKLRCMILELGAMIYRELGKRTMFHYEFLRTLSFDFMCDWACLLLVMVSAMDSAFDYVFTPLTMRSFGAIPGKSVQSC